MLYHWALLTHETSLACCGVLDGFGKFIPLFYFTSKDKIFKSVFYSFEFWQKNNLNISNLLLNSLVKVPQQESTDVWVLFHLFGDTTVCLLIGSKPNGLTAYLNPAY